MRRNSRKMLAKYLHRAPTLLANPSQQQNAPALRRLKNPWFTETKLLKIGCKGKHSAGGGGRRQTGCPRLSHGHPAFVRLRDTWPTMGNMMHRFLAPEFSVSAKKFPIFCCSAGNLCYFSPGGYPVNWPTLTIVCGIAKIT